MVNSTNTRCGRLPTDNFAANMSQFQGCQHLIFCSEGGCYFLNYIDTTLTLGYPKIMHICKINLREAIGYINISSQTLPLSFLFSVTSTNRI